MFTTVLLLINSSARADCPVHRTGGGFSAISEFVDLDGDGLVDVLGSDSSPPAALLWARNGGGGQMLPPREIGFATVSGACSIDAQGDGVLDVVALDYVTHSAELYIGLGGGAFAPRVAVAAHASGSEDPESVRAGDLDGDGDADLVIGWQGPTEVGWYENLGGTFGPERVIDANRPENVVWVELADLDGDGDLDVLAIERLTDDLVWYANDGLGTFLPAVTLSLSASRAALGTSTATAISI